MQNQGQNQTLIFQPQIQSSSMLMLSQFNTISERQGSQIPQFCSDDSISLVARSNQNRSIIEKQECGLLYQIKQENRIDSSANEEFNKEVDIFSQEDLGKINEKHSHRNKQLKKDYQKDILISKYIQFQQEDEKKYHQKIIRQKIESNHYNKNKQKQYNLMFQKIVDPLIFQPYRQIEDQQIINIGDRQIQGQSILNMSIIQSDFEKNSESHNSALQQLLRQDFEQKINEVEGGNENILKIFKLFKQKQMQIWLPINKSISQTPPTYSILPRFNKKPTQTQYQNTKSLMLNIKRESNMLLLITEKFTNNSLSSKVYPKINCDQFKHKSQFPNQCSILTAIDNQLREKFSIKINQTISSSISGDDPFSLRPPL